MKTRLIISICAFLVCLMGSDNSQAQIVVKIKPAKPKMILVKPAYTKQGHVWRNGHWRWNQSANKYVWAKGHWVKAKPSQIWVPGHWNSTSAGHSWIPGHWKKGGKRLHPMKQPHPHKKHH